MSKTSTKRFFRKIEVFCKRNALALLICFTTVLTLSVIGVSAYYSLTAGVEDSEMTSVPSNNIENNVADVASTSAVVFVSPVDTVTISKEYASDHLVEDKTTGIWQAHQAIDFSGTDKTAVKAVYSGTIENVEHSMMEGTIVTLKISDSLKVIYKSLSSDTLVSTGDKVSAGQEIGYLGTSVTEKAEGVHLHLEVKENDKFVDPNLYFSFADK